jgi:hypothetical protein
MRRRILSLVGGGLLLAGCASRTSNLAMHSAHFLGCPAEQIQISRIHRTASLVSWEAEGCGKRGWGMADDMMRHPRWSSVDTSTSGNPRP